mgnify:CR=1 FL=1
MIPADPRVDISALVVNYNSTRLAQEMLQSLSEQQARSPEGRPLTVEFVFVDNASPMKDPDALADIEQLAREVLPGKVVMHDDNLGYAGGMNLAYEHAKGEYILVLNPDLVFMEGCVEALYAHLRENPRTGACGPIGYWERGKEVRLPPNILPTMGDLWSCTLAHVFERANRRYIDKRMRAALKTYKARSDVQLDMLSGACLMLPRSVIEAMGGFFDDSFPLYYEDTDLFRRIGKVGKELVQVQRAEIAHFYNRSGTTNQGEAMRRYWIAKRHYYRKYYGWPGAWAEALSRRFLKTGVSTRARARLESRVVDIGDVSDPPTLELGRDCDEYLIEVCQDAAFLLAAGILGSGSSWTPGTSFWNAFGNSEYFLRCVDISGSRPEELIIYRFRRISHPALPEEPRVSTVKEA